VQVVKWHFKATGGNSSPGEAMGASFGRSAAAGPKKEALAMRVRNLTPIIAALGFFLVLGTMAIPAYAHPWKGPRWAANHPYKSWAMHHPYMARRFAMMRRRRNFLRNHPYLRGNPGARYWARNNWQNQ
jgi:hypothetical protein